jgi:hypothetical protein
VNEALVQGSEFSEIVVMCHCGEMWSCPVECR